MWHDGLLFKLKSYGISGCLFTVIKDFLNNRQQHVVLNGKSSIGYPVTAGAPQGSVLGPLLFLICVGNISSEPKLMGDDTSLFTVVYDVNIASDKLNRDLEIISNWAHQWKRQFNPDKNKHAVQVIFPRKKKQLLIRQCFSVGLKLLLKPC